MKWQSTTRVGKPDSIDSSAARVWTALLLTTLTLNALASVDPTPRTEVSALSVRVRITMQEREITVRGYDLRMDGLTESSRSLAQSHDRTSEWVLSCQKSSGSVDVRRVSPINQSAHQSALAWGTFASPAVIDSPAGFFQLNGRPYRNKLRVFNVKGHCEVVNELNLEKYLDGLINAEFSASWNKEAIAAQVIAARTYALYQIREARRLGAHFDVDSTIKDQVYDGSIKEDFRASQAVEKTRGQVLVTKINGRVLPLKAFYHSTCGGSTELPEQVWGGHFAGYSHSVSCPYCVSSPRYRWKVTIDSDKLRKIILGSPGEKTWPKDWSKVVSRSRLETIRPLSIDRSGRTTRVAFDFLTDQRIYTLVARSAQLREWVGSTQMLSTHFAIQKRADTLVIEGQGFGHGVGMCQWGAKVMGERGFNATQILAHYYPGATLKKLW